MKRIGHLFDPDDPSEIKDLLCRPLYCQLLENYLLFRLGRLNDQDWFNTPDGERFTEFIHLLDFEPSLLDLSSAATGLQFDALTIDIIPPSGDLIINLK